MLLADMLPLAIASLVVLKHFLLCWFRDVVSRISGSGKLSSSRWSQSTLMSCANNSKGKWIAHICWTWSSTVWVSFARFCDPCLPHRHFAKLQCLTRVLSQRATTRMLQFPVTAMTALWALRMPVTLRTAMWMMERGALLLRRPSFEQL